MRRNSNLILEDTRIIFRNFAGEETRFNRAGNRNFSVILNHEDALKLLDDGWNVKIKEPRDNFEDPLCYLEVTVKFDNIPPKIVMISGNKKTNLDCETVDVLDYADISTVDLIIRPYNWEVNGKTGVKAYLKTMYVTINRDEFEDKYDNLEDDLHF